MNEYLEFKRELQMLKLTKQRKRLLIHSCCGPCSSYVLSFLNEYFDIAVFYYNPNIYPQEEYYHRLEVQKEIIRKLDFNIPVIEGIYNHDNYLEAVKDSYMLGEGSKRCYDCYEERIKQTALLAEKLHFDYFTTVMSVSPYKNSEWINEIGRKYENNSKFLYSNFKKEEGYKESIRLSKEYDLYRQDYCGCEFSKKEHEEHVALKLKQEQENN